MAAASGPAEDHEFRGGWPVLLGSLIGIAIGVASIPGPAAGVFMRAMQHDFGWTRGEISAGTTILTIVLAAVSPFLGWLSDRVRTAWICGCGLLGLATSLFFFSRLGANLHFYYLLWAAMGVAAAGASTVAYARALSAAFVRHRGAALGLAMIGSGIAGMLLPLLLAPYVARVGWRQGYLALAVLVAIGAVPVFLMLLRAPKPAGGRGRVDVHAETAIPGFSFAAAIRERAFWTLAFCIPGISLATSGLHLHLIAFLSDSGVPAASAGRIAGFSGIAVIVTRPLAGWLFDRFFAPFVAAVFIAVGAGCIAAIAVFGAPVAILGALAVGLLLGTELDLVGYMTARYFGMRSYGRLYGILYLLMLLGAGTSVFLYGAAFDHAKSYQLAFVAAATILALCAFLFLTLPRFDKSVVPFERTHPRGTPRTGI